MNRAVFIASSYDENSPLNKVFSEGNGIVNTVNRMKEWKCQHVFKASRDDIFDFFSDSKDSCYQVFHFAGHALDKELQLNEVTNFIERTKITMTYNVGVGAIASTINAKKTIQLVILNGCSTVKQVETFKQVGVPAVIYTNQPLNDYLGSLFAKVFYKSFFEHCNTLQDAFNFAVNEVKTEAAKDQNSGIDSVIQGYVKRCIDIFEELPNKELYELDASDDMKKMRWEDWQNPLQNLGPTREIDTSVKSNMAIPDEAVHRCDRRDETLKYYKLIEQLATTESTGPFFFFVHEKSEANPFSLVKRFEHFGHLELCERNKALERIGIDWKYLMLPDIEEMTQQGIFRSRLFEIYDDVFKYYKNNDDFSFHQTEHGEKVFVIYHNLMDLQLEAGEANLIEDFLEYYLGEFSTKINAGLKAKIAVIFYCVYAGERADYIELFEKMANDARFCNRARNLTGMKPIKLDHIVTWRDKVFEGRLNPKPPHETELFPYPPNGNGTMTEVQAFLSQKIKAYNDQLKSPNA